MHDHEVCLFGGAVKFLLVEDIDELAPWNDELLVRLGDDLAE
mgnify:CR=1 FL=1